MWLKIKAIYLLGVIIVLLGTLIFFFLVNGYKADDSDFSGGRVYGSNPGPENAGMAENTGGRENTAEIDSPSGTRSINQEAPTGTGSGGSGNIALPPEQVNGFLPLKYVNFKQISTPDTQVYRINGFRYLSVDKSSGLSKFLYSGLAIILTIFSIYLYHVAQKTYAKHYDDEMIFESFVILICILLLPLWSLIVLYTKGLPYELMIDEFLNFPNQFVFIFMLISLVLLSIGIFRFTIVTFLPQTTEGVGNTDSRRSVIGISFAAIAVIANVVTIYQGLK